MIKVGDWVKVIKGVDTGVIGCVSDIKDDIVYIYVGNYHDKEKKVDDLENLNITFPPFEVIHPFFMGNDYISEHSMEFVNFYANKQESNYIVSIQDKMSEEKTYHICDDLKDSIRYMDIVYATMIAKARGLV